MKDLAENQIETEVYIRTGAGGRTPLYATSGSAGCDLFAAEALTLFPGQCQILPLDLVMAIEPGVEAQIRPRSGLSLKTELRLPNSPGTIDSDYRSPVGVLLQNTFSLDRLADQILSNPQQILELSATCRQMKLSQYLQEKPGQGDKPLTPDDIEKFARKFPELADRQIWLDQQGNPYGTIYIKPGDRIAQMVFSRCLKAVFHEHPQPETIGLDRGGGFGSTGVNHQDTGE